MTSATDIRSAFDATGTDKGSYHGYETVYERVGEPSSVLELGVHEGRSLVAWHMLWPKAEIWGVEINKISPLAITIDPKIHIVYGDAFSVNTPIHWNQRFDLIVDDANHHPMAQVRGVEIYWRQLSEGGWYVIEDVLDPDYLTDKLLDIYDDDGYLESSYHATFNTLEQHGSIAWIGRKLS